MKVRRQLILRLIGLGMTALLYSDAAVSLDYLPSYVATRHRAAIETWLASHSGFRLATDADCSCADDIAKVRVASPGYHPYYAAGDFRGDGNEDVAVGVISGRLGRFRVLIIHSNPDDTRAPIEFLSEALNVRQGLSYGLPWQKPLRLGVGPVGSEGVTFEPVPNGYRISGDRRLLHM